VGWVDEDPEVEAERAKAKQEQETSRKTKPNGRDPNSPWREIEIVRYADMQARLDTRPLVKDFLQHEQLSLFFGETGCGKTFLVLGLALHIAAGLDWFGRRVDQGAVVYVAAEAGRSIFNRVAAFKRATGISDIPFFAVTSSLDLCHAAVGDLDRLIATIKSTTSEAIRHVTIDTVSRALAGGDENGPADMGAFVKSMDCLRDEFSSHITAVHHTGKNHALGARGHSLLKANLDTEVEVAFDASTSVRIATITKQRDGTTGVIIPFKLRPVELGRNQDGDPVYSCVVEKTEGATRAQSSKAKALPAAQRRALDLLGEAINKDGEIPPACDHIPPHTPCVSEDLWRKYCYAGQVAESDKPDAKRQAFNRNAKALIAASRIGKWDEFVWIVPPAGAA
jgi:hypothetical protein